MILANGWTRRAIAFLAGAAGALALAPFNLFPVAFISMVTAVWLIDGSARFRSGRASMAASIWAAFGVGWWWGFGYFVAGLWWLGSAFLVDADRFAWLLPLGVVALPAALAFFPALGFALARALWSSGGTRVLALAAGLGASEWLRGVILTGFPWNDLGMMLGSNLVLAQIASIGGLHELTFLAVAIFASPAALADEQRGRARPFVIAVLALAALAAFGALRLQGASSETVKGVRLRIMQANIAQGSDFSPANKDAILGEYLSLSDRATSPTTNGVVDATHLIWPESAFPFLIARDPGALTKIANLLRGGAVLITGAARAETASDGRDHYFNSIQVIDHTGALLGRYDKVRLVPFGEYMPFGGFWDRIGLSQFVHVPGGFDAGRQGQPLLSIPGLPVARPMICYEAIFPDEIGTLITGPRARAGWIVNVTDDAWFGITPGPAQHFAQARLRAIEQGLPLVRAANTGESAIIDPMGVIVAQRPLGVSGVLDGPLPIALPAPPYVALGCLVPGATLFAFVLIALIARRRG